MLLVLGVVSSPAACGDGGVGEGCLGSEGSSPTLATKSRYSNQRILLQGSAVVVNRRLSCTEAFILLQICLR